MMHCIRRKEIKWKLCKHAQCYSLRRLETNETTNFLRKHMHICMFLEGTLESWKFSFSFPYIGLSLNECVLSLQNLQFPLLPLANLMPKYSASPSVFINFPTRGRVMSCLLRLLRLNSQGRFLVWVHMVILGQLFCQNLAEQRYHAEHKVGKWINK